MGRLRGKAAECLNKEYNNLMTQQFISGPNDDEMIDEILKELAMLEDIEYITSEHVLWACRVEAQKVQQSALNDIKEAKDFDIVRQNMQKQGHTVSKMHKREDRCKYCGTENPLAVACI